MGKNNVIDSLDIVQVTETPDKVYYLDYVMSSEKTTYGGIIGLKVYSSEVPRFEHSLELKYPDGVGYTDADISIDDQVNDFYMRAIVEELLVCSHRAHDLDIQLDGSTNSARRFLSKMISAATLVATTHRRGPGTFALMSSKLFDMLPTFSPPSGYLYAPGDAKNRSGYIAGIKIILCDGLGDLVLVGRKGKPDEPGVNFSCDEILAGDYIRTKPQDVQGLISAGKYEDASKFEPERVSHVNLKFHLGPVGSRQPYVSFIASSSDSSVLHASS